MNINIIGNTLIPTEINRIKSYIGRISRDDDKTLYLTFDDGPHPVYTAELLELLRVNEVKASFFVVADFAKDDPGLISRMKSEGHLVGLHSLRHKCLAFQNRAESARDMEEEVRIMEDMGMMTCYYRPPWGIVNLSTMDELKARNMELVMWDVMVGDWKASATAEKIADKLRKKAGGGSIICLHDGRGRNNAPLKMIGALEKIIPEWKKIGYKFDRVDKLYEKTGQ